MISLKHLTEKLKALEDLSNDVKHETAEVKNFKQNISLFTFHISLKITQTFIHHIFTADKNRCALMQIIRLHFNDSF